MRQYELPVVVERDRDGYFAACPLLQGCYSQGKTYEETLENIRDAVRLHIKDRRAHGERIPSLESVSLAHIKIAV